MKILQTNAFKRAAKKLHCNQQAALKEAIQKIKEDPLIGKLKKGDLAGVRVYKFYICRQHVLLAYIYEESEASPLLILLALSPHENFYEDLKRHIKNTTT